MPEIKILIKAWLIKNITRKPQVLRHRTLAGGLLVINPGQEVWVNPTAYSEACHKLDWVKTICNDLDIENEMAREEDRSAGEMIGVVGLSTPPTAKVHVKLDTERPDGFLRPAAVEVDTPPVEILDKADIFTEEELASVAPKIAAQVTCAGHTKAGLPCGKKPTKGSLYCHAHEPYVPEEEDQDKG